MAGAKGVKGTVRGDDCGGSRGESESRNDSSALVIKTFISCKTVLFWLPPKRRAESAVGEHELKEEVRENRRGRGNRQARMSGGPHPPGQSWKAAPS